VVLRVSTVFFLLEHNKVTITEKGSIETQVQKGVGTGELTVSNLKTVHVS